MGHDNFYQNMVPDSLILLQEWPFAYAVGLLGEVRFQLNVQAEALEAVDGDGLTPEELKKLRERTRKRAYHTTGTLDRIQQAYGRRFQSYAAALPYMEEIVEKARKKVYERAKKYHDEEKIST